MNFFDSKNVVTHVRANRIMGSSWRRDWILCIRRVFTWVWGECLCFD